jgi:hypothetical protein
MPWSDASWKHKRCRTLVLAARAGGEVQTQLFGKLFHPLEILASACCQQIAYFASRT